jgi:xanthine dehydrogenase small subunit
MNTIGNSTITFKINDENCETDFSPTLTLLQYLQKTGRTGTKEGCGDGDCGACTVALLGKDATGKPCYQAVNSCLLPLGAIAGREIITVEGISDGKQLHPVQAAMVELGGSQCGYCTPGFIMSMFAAYYDRQIDDLAIEGNLCRCTGYLPIRRSVQKVMQELAIDQHDRFQAKLTAATVLPIKTPNRPLAPNSGGTGIKAPSIGGLEASQISQIKPDCYSDQSTQYLQPTTIAQTLDFLQTHPEATIIAGGTDLGLDLSHHRHAYPILISLEQVTELQQIQETAEHIRIGAAIPLSHIQSKLQGHFPSLDTMLHWFAARQVRNRATIGGNLGTASPIGDLAPVFLALDATIELVSIDGERTLPLTEFFQGYRQTALQPGEIIVSVTIPKLRPGVFNQSDKIGKRGTDDISIVSAAFTIELSQDLITKTRLAYGGVAATPIRATEVEAQLIGQPWTIETVHAIKPSLEQTFSPLSDLRASAAYRQTLVANLFEKFFAETQGLT